MHDAEPHVRETHAGDVLRHGHPLARRSVLAVIDGGFEMLRDQFDGFQFEHVGHRPRTFGNIALDGVGQGVHTRRGGQPLRHRIHQFGIDDGHRRNVVGIDADHLLAGLLVDDDVVDRHLGGGSGGGRQREGRHGAAVRVGRPFERLHVGELGVVGHDADTLGRVDDRTAAQRHDEVGTRSLEGGYAVLHVGDGRIGLHVGENFIGNAGSAEHLLDLGGHAEADEVGIRHEKGFLVTAAACLVGNHRAASGAEIGDFIQYDTLHSCN